MEIKNGTEFKPLPPVAVLVTPKLDQRQSATLLSCVNEVRSGEATFSVAVTYRKVTKAKPRIAGLNYQPLPGVEPIFHEGTLVAAPTNKKGAVYLLVRDAARAPLEVIEAPHGGEMPVGPKKDEEGEEVVTGWTALSLAGIESFRVLPNGRLPGPVALAREVAKAQALTEVAAAIAKVQGQ